MTARPESRDFSKFWMPDQVRHDELGTFYETIKINAFFLRVYIKNSITQRLE
jgi:hypothetical protein